MQRVWEWTKWPVRVDSGQRQQYRSGMKLFALLFLVLCAVLAIEGVPAKKKVEPKCAIVCTTDYTPVCAGVPDDKSVKPKLFGNECVLEKHNCENKSNLVKISEDQCKNAGGVRLF